MNKIPNPKIIFPISLLLSPLENKTIKAPIPTKTGAIAARSRATSCPVTVVPIFAPIITPAAWYKFISPALTKPITITVVALLLCIIAVTIVPINIPL
ncbi:hypothetical protein SDC9_178379 [bioreactor metagenome]|uniref:Uncharacterized protein n=1 Tax=bioreactor metagenome TaxID=1076179 RepID=A0A645GVR7_9ZZZZ